MSDTPKDEETADSGLPGTTCSESSLPYWTPRLKKILAMTVKTAREYGHTYVGSEHLIAGILREEVGFAAVTLINAGLTWDAFREKMEWKSAADLTEARERAEYERLRAKFDPQNDEHVHHYQRGRVSIMGLRFKSL